MKQLAEGSTQYLFDEFNQIGDEILSMINETLQGPMKLVRLKNKDLVIVTWSPRMKGCPASKVPGQKQQTSHVDVPAWMMVWSCFELLLPQ